MLFWPTTTEKMGCVISGKQSVDASSRSLIMGSRKQQPTNDLKFKYVVVGFGVAGGYAARELAQLGVGEFEVALVGEEPSFAYERPVLSKAYLFPPDLVSKPPARLPGFNIGSAEDNNNVQTDDWYQQRNWTCYLSTRVVSVDFKSKSIKLMSNQTGLEERIEYERLIMCTGGKPNRFRAVPGAEQVNRGIYHMYNEEDFALLVRKLERVTGKRFVNRKLMAQKKGGKSTGVLQSTRKLDELERHQRSNTLQNEDLDEDGMAATTRAVVLGGGVLGVELACALSAWSLDEVCIVTQTSALYSEQTKWSGKFRTRVVAEINKRTKFRLVFEDTVGKVTGSSAMSLHSVVLAKTQEEIPTSLLVVAIGSTANRDPLLVGNKFEVDVRTLRMKNAQDVWVAGELALANCGAGRAREMGRQAARAAFHGKVKPQLFDVPSPHFASSRLFEHTNNPVIWYEMGDFTNTGEEHSVEVDSDDMYVVFYFNPQTGVLCAALAVGNSVTELNLIRSRVESGKITRQDM